MRTIDKLNQAKHHAENMMELGKKLRHEIPSDQFLHEIQKFRYEFSSFISAARSVTFVLQSDLRKKYGEEFDLWYDSSLTELFNPEIAKKAVFIRNVVEKQGNRIPTFYIKQISNSGKEIHTYIDLSLPYPNSLLSINMEASFLGDFHFKDVKSEKDLQNQFNLLFYKEYFPKIIDKINELTMDFTDVTLKVEKLHIGEDVKITVKEFTNFCIDYFNSLNSLVKKAYKQFTDD